MSRELTLAQRLRKTLDNACEHTVRRPTGMAHGKNKGLRDNVRFTFTAHEYMELRNIERALAEREGALTRERAMVAMYRERLEQRIQSEATKETET